jgi:small subunit ribosomal protein S6
VGRSVYESAILINATLDDQQIESIITKVKDLIINNDGEIRELENWGRKRLAYPVEKNKIGYYAIFRFDAPGDIVAKLERAYSLDEQILRFITLKLSKNALEQIEKNKSLSTTLKEEPVSEPIVDKTELAETETDLDTEDNGK